MKFWDTSAVVPLILEQQQSRELRKLASSDPEIVVWWATEVECASALVRAEREQKEASPRAYVGLVRMADAWRMVGAEAALKQVSVRLLRRYPLGAPDSMQLAAALMACEHRPETLPFVCLDRRLREAAEKEGFAVLPE